MAPLPHDSASRLEAGYMDDKSKSPDEKTTLAHFDNHHPIPTTTGEERRLGDRMPSAGRFIVMLLLSLLVTLGIASAAVSPKPWLRQPCPGENAAGREALAAADGGDSSTFTALLETASPHSLHELLHKYFPERFKHGVWESDVSAVEALHRVDETLAVNLVQMAKRQDNGTTTSASEPASTPSTTSTPPPTTSNPPDTTSDVPPPGTTTSPPPTTTSPPTGAPSTTTPGTTPPGTTPPGTTAPSTSEPGTSAPPTTTTPTPAAPETTPPDTTAAPPATTSQRSSQAGEQPTSQVPSSNNAPSMPNNPPLTTTRGPTSSGTSSSSDLLEAETSSSSMSVPVSVPPTSISSGRGTPATGPGITSRPGPSSTSRPLGASTLITHKPTSRAPTTSPRLVTSTFTSTRPDGGVVIVTATSYVSGDSPQTETPTAATKPAPSLQNTGSRRQGYQVAGAGAGIALGAAVLLI